MEEILTFVKEYGAYIALPLVVAGLAQAAKRAFTKFFKQSVIGLRIWPFIPIALGVLGGLLLPEPSQITARLLIGGGLGAISEFIYKFFTRTIAKKSKLLEKIDNGG